MCWQKGGNAANTSAVLGLLGEGVDFFGTTPYDQTDFASELKWRLIKYLLFNVFVSWFLFFS